MMRTRRTRRTQSRRSVGPGLAVPRQVAAPLALLAAPLALLAMAGCAGTPPPVADLTQAHTLVAQAEQSDAPRYDGADLASAQDKLQQADQASHEHPASAARMAMEASADAQLALARTNAGKQRDALKQVNDSLAALQQQLHDLSGADANGTGANEAGQQPGEGGQP
jgi:hypothetical protein